MRHKDIYRDLEAVGGDFTTEDLAFLIEELKRWGKFICFKCRTVHTDEKASIYCCATGGLGG